MLAITRRIIIARTATIAIIPTDAIAESVMNIIFPP
jgi:hypothetical protein